MDEALGDPKLWSLESLQTLSTALAVPGGTEFGVRVRYGIGLV